jgi:hypothetical protein
MDLVTMLHRAAGAPPRSFSLMLRTSTLARLEPLDAAHSLGRAHRVVVCEDGEPASPPTGDLARARIGYLPRPIDPEAFAIAIGWLSGLPGG